jgi:ribosomal protein S18 acetylase RimI-like enzyme
MKIVSIESGEFFTIRIVGKSVFSLYNHHIMHIETNISYEKNEDYHIERITVNNISECSNGEFNTSFMKSYLLNQEKMVDGFLLKYHENPVGYIWIMYKGGNEAQYRIRNIDSFLFDVCIFENERGKGHSKVLMQEVLCYLNSKGIDDVYLAVRRNNKIAINLYKKIGWEIICNKTFIRICRVNIPYYKL